MSASELTVPYRPGFCVGLGVSSFIGEAAVRLWAFPDVARPQLNTGTIDEGAQPRTIHFEEGFIDRKDHYLSLRQLKGCSFSKRQGLGHGVPTRFSRCVIRYAARQQDSTLCRHSTV